MSILNGEPRLDLNDIQGHIYPGFGTAFSALAGLRLAHVHKGREALRRLLPEVTTMNQAIRDRLARRYAYRAGETPRQPFASLGISVSAAALEMWGFGLDGLDLSFREGMFQDAEALGDPLGPDRRPLDWTFSQDDQSRVHVLLVAGHSSEDALHAAMDRWLAMLEPHFTIVTRDFGRRREGDKEFFGFKDGVSQPDIRGVSASGEAVSRRAIDPEDNRARRFSRPGRQLVWPGNFIFGYARETSDPLKPGPEAVPPQPWMRNASYLVFRKLKQDVTAFQSAVAALEARLRDLGETLPEGWVAARLVGRWPDGTPLHASPDCPDRTLSGDSDRINNFAFLSALEDVAVCEPDGTWRDVPGTPADPRGFHLPRVSHVRQINPRDGESERGSEFHPGTLMLRRGIAFGPEVADEPQADRGLLFLAYQTSIVDQFKFVQTSWANSGQRPVADGLDPIIGQDGTLENRRMLTFYGPTRRQHRCPMDGRWVIATGGEYLLTPGLAGLDHITRTAPLNRPAPMAPRSRPTPNRPGPGPGPGHDATPELTAINGIGPRIRERLQGAGITTIAQIAAWSDGDIAAVDAALRLGGRPAREDWVGQAKKLAAAANP